MSLKSKTAHKLLKSKSYSHRQLSTECSQSWNRITDSTHVPPVGNVGG